MSLDSDTRNRMQHWTKSKIRRGSILGLMPNRAKILPLSSSNQGQKIYKKDMLSQTTNSPATQISRKKLRSVET